VEFAEADEKEYSAGIRFGITTDTQDITGTVLSEKPVAFTAEQLDGVLESFKGDILQVPPMYSAIKVNGKKLYEIARKGGNVERQSRRVHIYALERGEVGDEMSLTVRCSKGTYIRTLCDDIGRALGCGACMSSLRRTRAGEFDISQAHTMEEIIAAAECGAAESMLLGVDVLFAGFPAFTLSENQDKQVRNGGGFSSAMGEGKYRAYSPNGEFAALMECKEGEMSTIKSFYEV
jgi:tRNA pseudouridine55 synthase